MKIKDLMSVSGLPGLYRLIATKKSGIVAESLESGQKKFLSARSYQFSPLESIAIYTDTDAIPLEDVFKKMNDHPPVENLSKSDLRDYFTEILPDHDQSKVYASDIKKMVTWYNYLNENGFLDEEPTDTDVTEEDSIKDATEEE